MKAHLPTIQKNLDKENVRDNQARWEYLKYEIKKKQMGCKLFG